MTALARFRHKPTVVEAIRWTGGNAAEVMDLTGREYFDVLNDQDRANCDDPDATATVFDKLHSTWVLVFDGQWIAKGTRGELWPIADEVFRDTYDPADGPAPVEVAVRKADLDVLVAACTSYLPTQVSPEVGAAFARLLTAFGKARREPVAIPAPGAMTPKPKDDVR